MKLKVILATTLLFSLFVTPTHAATDFYTPQILPDSPLYIIKTWKEQLDLFLTLNPTKKIEVLSNQAEKRLAEAKILIDNGKITVAQKQMLKYQETFQKALTRVQALSSEDAKNSALENMTNNSNAELTALTSAYDAAKPESADIYKEVVAMVSQTQSQIVATAPVNFKEGIKNKVDKGRLDILNSANSKVKSILPARIDLDLVP